jgi:PEP-CTERM motif
MKISRILCTVALVGLSLGLSAAVAHADGTDPTVKANRTPTDPVCNPDTDVDCLGRNNTLTLNLNGITTLNVGGSQPLTELSVTFAGVDGDSYNCFTDIFVTCSTIFHQVPGGFTVTDLFTGGPGNCMNNGDEIPAGGFCSGMLDPGDEITIQGIFPDGTGPVQAFASAPEPSSILLMGLGLTVLFAFSRKRIASNLPV